MRYAIIEDNVFAAKHLEMAVSRLRPQYRKVFTGTSVESTVNYLRTSEEPDLIFMDIELFDGKCFEIFDAVQTTVPVIFTTAYDDFALKAIKVNCVDYLLKPVTPEALSHAIDKFEHLFAHHNDSVAPTASPVVAPATRILTVSGDKYNYINTDRIAYFVSEDDYVFAYLNDDDKRHLINITSLSDLELILSSSDFFRLSRNVIASIKSIKGVSKYLRGRLLVKVSSGAGISEFSVPASRREPFLLWLGR